MAKNVEKLSTEIKLFSKNTCFYNRNQRYISITKCPITLVSVFTYVVTSGLDMVCNSRCMTGTRNPFEYSVFPSCNLRFVLLHDVEFLTAPTTSLIQNLTPAFPFKNCFKTRSLLGRRHLLLTVNVFALLRLTNYFSSLHVTDI